MDSVVAVTKVQPSVESLYRADADRLWRAVYAFAGDPDIASDSVAEAYAQLLRRGSEVREPAAWTWRAAFRISAGTLKARAAGSGGSTTTEHEDHYADTDL